MTELDPGKTEAQEPEPEAGRRAHASRRNFMRKVFFASGATAVATMGGAGAWAALADDTVGTTDAPGGAPSGAPGGPATRPSPRTSSD
ncbi:hypothetical protein [Streptomyces sp. NPDC059402]|uniref:hypothetical protein n=1 Tax=Streptomyces sp. NPDC059402 TaxID=3346822 RepID=UPI0036B2A8E8